MNLETQFKLRSNSNYQKYIRENSHWYKTLNREPEKFNDMVNEAKEYYKLRPTDRIGDFVDKLDVINNILSIFK
jgi:6-phosphogluconate dehydrogenase